MILALIKNNKVVNTIVAEAESIASNYPDCIVVRIDNLETVPSIGWDYINEQFINNLPVAEPEENE